MIKFIALIKRKPGITLEEFIDLYEKGHAVFAAPRLHNIRHYERRFIRPYGNPVDGQHFEPDFDVITELWFDDRAALDKAMAMVAEQADAFAEDEAKLFDRAAIRTFVIEEERQTQL